MFKIIDRIFGRKKAPESQHDSKREDVARPNTPLEILVPENVTLNEAPKLAGKTISYFIASSTDINIIEYFSDEDRIDSNNNDLKQFLFMVAGANQLNNLFSQCTAVLYSPKVDGSIGDLACIQQSNLYSFAVFEKSPAPNLKWEIHRRVRPITVG